MMELSKIDSDLLSQLSGAYLHTGFIFGTESIGASERKQRKFKKWMSKQYPELLHSVPEEIGSGKELLSFLKACYEESQRREKKKAEQLEEDLAVLGEECKAAFKLLQDIICWPEIEAVDNGIQIVIDDTPAYRQTLFLKDAEGVPKDKDGFYLSISEFVYEKNENSFCIYGELEDPIEDLNEPFSITFRGAEVTTEIYNACTNTVLAENPWEILRTVSFSIGMKENLPGDYCNHAEKELLPLIREITALEYWLEFPKQEYYSFPLLKALADRYGYEKVKLLLAKLETVKPGDSDYHNTVKKLISHLCQKKHEPMWREIWEKLEASQEEYPNKVDSLCCGKLLAEVRGDIQKKLEAYGYAGTYPDFVKDGKLKGVHLEQSYDMTYFVGMENRVRYRIHCCESLGEEGYLDIQFLCGTAFLKKGEEAEDIYCCLFNAGGRRLFHTAHHYVPLGTAEDTRCDDMETSTRIAMKKVECKRLNKKERKEYYGKMLPGWSTFWWIFLVGGGLFGIAAVLFALIFCISTAIVFGLVSDIPEMLSGMPWGLLFAVGWIGFGASMGITELLAQRK